MAQADYTIDNGTGLAVRTEINATLEAIASLNSGPTAPSPTFPNMWWFDETAGTLKRRNAANTAWDSYAAKAAEVSVTPSGGLASTDVQAAVDELEAAKLSKAGGEVSGTLGLSAVSGQIIYSGADRGGSFLDIDAPNISTDKITYRFFRATNTTGTAVFIVHRGDGTAASNMVVDADGIKAGGGGTSAVIADLNAVLHTRAYTVATVPSASAKGAGAMIYVTNESGGAVLATSDGTNWRRSTDRAIIS